ncbi:MAG: hypothetical protein ACK5BN_06685 [Planctomycetota bacterium]
MNDSVPSYAGCRAAAAILLFLGTGALVAQTHQPGALGTAVTNGTNFAVLDDGGGRFLLGGNFPVPGGSEGIFRFDASSGSLTSLGNLVVSSSELVWRLDRAPSGDPVAMIFPTSIDPVRLFSSGTWTTPAVGTVFNASVDCMVVHAGSPVIGGSFTAPGDGLMQLLGGSWTNFTPALLPPSPTTTVRVNDLLVASNGDLVAAGEMADSAGLPCEVARLSGGVWTAVGGTQFPFGARRIYEDTNGALIAIAVNAAAQEAVHRFDGTNWVTLGSFDGFVSAVLPLPDGDLVATGQFNNVNNTLTGSLAKFDGTSWQQLATLSIFGQNGSGHETKLLASGRMIITGNFDAVNGSPESGIAAFGADTPGSVTNFGVNCGFGTLSSSTMPLIGAPYRTTAVGLVPGSIGGVLLLDFAPVSPVPADFGCQISVGIALMVPIAPPLPTNLPIQFEIPNAPSIVGSSFLQQLATLYLSPTGNIQIATTVAENLLLGRF